MTNHKNSKRKTPDEGIQFMRFIANSNKARLLDDEWKGSESKYRFIIHDNKIIQLKYHILLMRGWPRKYKQVDKTLSKHKIINSVNDCLSNNNNLKFYLYDVEDHFSDKIDNKDFNSIYLMLVNYTNSLPKDSERYYSFYKETFLIKELYFMRYAKNESEYKDFSRIMKIKLKELNSILLLDGIYPKIFKTLL